jgi:hypothetical protein
MTQFFTIIGTLVCYFLFPVIVGVIILIPAMVFNAGVAVVARLSR